MLIDQINTMTHGEAMTVLKRQGFKLMEEGGHVSILSSFPDLIKKICTNLEEREECD